MVSKRKTGNEFPNDKSKKAKGEPAAELQLRVHPEPPTFPYINHFFDLDVFLIEGSKESKKCGLVIPLDFQIVFDDTKVPIPKTLKGLPIVETEPKEPFIDETGQTKVRVKLCELSMDRENKKFRVVVKVKGGDLSNKLAVGSVLSRPVHVIRYRLKLVDQPPTIWYKDQGGRENCIELNVQLLNQDGNVVKGHEVPLRLSLQYEDGTSVVNHNKILKCMPDKLGISANGTAQLRIRIEDVSKNHQSKSFVIRVEPDTQQSPVHFDVAPDFSEPVQVRSKLNKKAKQKQANAPTKDRKHPSRGSGGAAMGTVPAPTMSTGPVNPPSILPPGASYSPSSPNAAAVRAAMWCDHVKDALYQLQALSMQRTAIESHLFALLSQYESAIGGFIKPLVGDVKGDPAQSGLLSETSSTQRRLAARPVLGPTESFSLLKNQFSLGQSLGIQMHPLFTNATQSGAGLSAVHSMGLQGLEVPGLQQPPAKEAPQHRPQVKSSGTAFGNKERKRSGEFTRPDPPESLQPAVSLPDFVRLNSLFLPGQVFGTSAPSSATGKEGGSRYAQEYDDEDEDECEDSKVHYMLNSAVGSEFQSANAVVPVLRSKDKQNLGFPSFDIEGKLVGFYYPQETIGHSTIGFKTKEDMVKEGKTNDSTCSELELKFLKEIALPNRGMLSSVESCTPRTGYHLAEKVINMVRQTKQS